MSGFLFNSEAQDLYSHYEPSPDGESLIKTQVGFDGISVSKKQQQEIVEYWVDHFSPIAEGEHFYLEIDDKGIISPDWNKEFKKFFHPEKFQEELANER